MPGVLRDYALFHALVAFICCTVAIVRLRAVFLREVSGPRRKRKRTSSRWRCRPSVGNRPMLWKEMFSGPRMSSDWLGRIALALVVGISFAPAIWIGYYFYFEPLVIGDELPAVMNGYVRVVGTIVACASLFAVALRASSSVTTERERQTWDSVLITPLDRMRHPVRQVARCDSEPALGSPLASGNLDPGHSHRWVEHRRRAAPGGRVSGLRRILEQPWALVLDDQPFQPVRIFVPCWSPPSWRVATGFFCFGRSLIPRVSPRTSDGSRALPSRRRCRSDSWPSPLTSSRPMLAGFKSGLFSY